MVSCLHSEQLGHKKRWSFVSFSDLQHGHWTSLLLYNFRWSPVGSHAIPSFTVNTLWGSVSDDHASFRACQLIELCWYLDVVHNHSSQYCSSNVLLYDHLAVKNSLLVIGSLFFKRYAWHEDNRGISYCVSWASRSVG